MAISCAVEETAGTAKPATACELTATAEELATGADELGAGVELDVTAIDDELANAEATATSAAPIASLHYQLSTSA